MSFAALRDLALSLNLWAHGVDVEVCVDEHAEPVQTRGIWLSDTTNEAPVGASFGRREAVKAMLLPRTGIDSFKRGMRLRAPRRDGGGATGWVVDSLQESHVDHVCVVLVPAPGV